MFISCRNSCLLNEVILCVQSSMNWRDNWFLWWLNLEYEYLFDTLIFKYYFKYNTHKYIKYKTLKIALLNISRIFYTFNVILFEVVCLALVCQFCFLTDKGHHRIPLKFVADIWGLCIALTCLFSTCFSQWEISEMGPKSNKKFTYVSILPNECCLTITVFTRVDV